LKIGILNGGGDCAGLNAVTRAVVRQCEQFGFEIIGIRHGWAGLIDIDTVPLNWKTVSHVIKDGGTILHTTRTNPFSRPQGPETVLKNVKKLGLDTLIAVGGEDTLSVCAKLSQMGLRSIGVPKTIDNDVYATDVTFGFDSAVNVTVEAIDRIETTAESHDRIMIVEVMGRDAGWIAAYAGIASGANLTLVPEEPFDLDEISNFLRNRHQSGATMSIVIVGEGCRLKGLSSNQNSAMVDEFGHPRLGGIGELLAKELEKRVGIETRVVVLGHLVRGGRPSAYDRILATRLGAAAVQAVKDEEFNVMVCLHNNKLTRIPITEILGRIKKLDEGTLSLVKDFTI